MTSTGQTNETKTKTENNIIINTKGQSRIIDSAQYTTGSVTLPVEPGKEEQVIPLAKQWGADAIRDSDGTSLTEPYLELGHDVYSTICLVRADQKYARQNPDQLPQKYLMSHPVTATSNTTEIDLLKGFFRRKYTVDTTHNPQTFWQVIDRTSGDSIDNSNWQYNETTGKLTIHNAKPFHAYTVNFLVYQIWDSVSMYNHLTNGWTIEPIQSVDPYLPKTYQHLMNYFDQWLKDHPNTTVVRLTTLAYNFTLDSDETGQDKYRDWLGYTDCISPKILDDFSQEKGYRLQPEDIVDQGYYNSTSRVPSEKYLDWMDFIQKFVIQFGKDLVQKSHAAGKKTALFWGDHWIGTEPYSDKYQEMGIDINIGACEDGVALRRLADAPGNQTREIRLYPYFFPDVFTSDGNPLAESQDNWVKIRRAMLRNCVDRIGYGGYTSLALKFPDFVDHVKHICDEFRTIKSMSKQTKPYTSGITVYILNAWGKRRSWLNNTTADEKFNNSRPDIVTIVGSNLLESLSGLPVDVRFISFRDIEQNGIPQDASIIINDGIADTAWSGGHWWSNESVTSQIRQFVFNGGGFIGVGDPSAFEYQGRFFQLADILGVQKEAGQTLGAVPEKANTVETHFITQNLTDHIQTGTGKSFVYPYDQETDILRTDPDGHIELASKTFGQGRSVYLSALPFSLANAKLLYRILTWVSNKEDKIHTAYSDDIDTECAFYPETGKAVIINNTNDQSESTVYGLNSEEITLTLAPYESRWIDIKKD